jgi:glycosyltransferase 2 family protein
VDANEGAPSENTAPGAAVSESPSRIPRWRAALLVAMALVCLTLVMSWAGPARIVALLREIRWLWLALTAISIICATTVGAWNAYVLSAFHATLSFTRFLAAFWCAWAVGLVLPGQVGDLVSMTAMLRRLGIPGPSALGRLGVDKLISLLVILAAAGLLPLVVHDARLRLAAALLVLIGVLLIAGFALATRWRARLLQPAGAGRVRNMIARTASEAIDLVRLKPRTVLANVVMSILKMGLTGLSYWATLAALGHSDVGLFAITVVASSAGLIAYVPLSLNGVGTVEIVGVVLFGALGLGGDVVVSMYLLLRVLNLALAWLPMAIALPVALR